MKLPIGLVICLVLSAAALADVKMPESSLELKIGQTDTPALALVEGGPAVPVSGAVINQPKKISKTKAIALTLLLPGAGHLYIGEQGRGEVFIGADLIAWAAALTYNIYGNWKKDDYINYAEAHAGINTNGKDDTYYELIAFYDNLNEYNILGRNYELDREYYPKSTHDWKWDSESSRGEYRAIRNSSESAFRNSTFMVGVALANRIIAGIDLFRLMKKKGGSKDHGRDEEDDEEVNDDILGQISNLKLKLSGNPPGEEPGVRLTLVHRF
jgi:hypothetical protein